MTPPLSPAVNRYGVIVADPPWRYDNGSAGGGVNYQYSTMTTSDIAALPIAGLAKDDSILLLWATWPKLTEAMTVIAGWGFEYLTGFPWIKIEGMPQVDFWGELRVKPQYGIGFWVRGCSEPILICRRGNVSPPSNGFVGLLAKNIQHSRKPEDIYQFAESLPGPYLELFARRKRPGWDVWGNQVESDVDLNTAPARLLAGCL